MISVTLADNQNPLILHLFNYKSRLEQAKLYWRLFNPSAWKVEENPHRIQQSDELHSNEIVNNPRQSHFDYNRDVGCTRISLYVEN